MIEEVSIPSFFSYYNYNLSDMKSKRMICVGNKAVLSLYKKQDWWKSYIKNVLAQTYRGDDCSPIDPNDIDVKRHKLGILFCKCGIETLSKAFVWRYTDGGHDFWSNKAIHMRSYRHFTASDKYVYTSPLKNLFFSK